LLPYYLSRADSLCRANISACTTIDTFIGIYFIDITFRNGFGRTFRKTGTTGSAFITNYISHDKKFLLLKETKIML